MSPTIDNTFLINLRKKVSSRDNVGKFTVLTKNQITSLINNPPKSLQELKNILGDGHPYLD
ncbi:HRDC domain-containing protein, partial [bacterium]|nr:HRDC domain-containing protein [bacterium]